MFEMAFSQIMSSIQAALLWKQQPYLTEHKGKFRYERQNQDHIRKEQAY